LIFRDSRMLVPHDAMRPVPFRSHGGKMTTVSTAHISRAIDHLHLAGAADEMHARAAAFSDAAWAILRSGSKAEARRSLEAHGNPILRDAVTKAGASVLGDFGGSGATAELAAAYVASIGELALLEQIKRYARVLPLHGSGRPLIASGFTADSAVEGAPKVVRSLSVSLGDDASAKPAAILVLSDELARMGADAAQRLFEDELRRAVVRGSNAAILAALTDSSTITLPSTGDALADLRAGLAAAEPSEGYVVAAETGLVADLATRAENRGGMGVRGGTFTPGVEIVAVDGASGMQVIPASRVAVRDYGLRIASAEHADVDMSSTPTSPSAMVSLFATNSVGLRAEWPFSIAADSPTVVVSGS